MRRGARSSAWISWQNRGRGLLLEAAFDSAAKRRALQVEMDWFERPDRDGSWNRSQGLTGDMSFDHGRLSRSRTRIMGRA